MNSMITEAILMLRIKGDLLFLNLIPMSLRASPAQGNTANGSGCIAALMLRRRSSSTRARRVENMSMPAKVAMAAPMILILSLRFFESSHAYIFRSHKPVSHPIRGKMSDMINTGGYSLGARTSVFRT